MRDGLASLPVGLIQKYQKLEENQEYTAEHFQSSLIAHLSGTSLVHHQLTVLLTSKPRPSTLL